jgi:hypothetical protein
MLMPEERALLLQYCDDHPVAACPRCSEAVTFDHIGAGVITATRDFCPSCHSDLTNVLRGHLAECTLMRVQAREVRDLAGNRASAASPNNTRTALRESECLRDKGQAAIEEPPRRHELHPDQPGGCPPGGRCVR